MKKAYLLFTGLAITIFGRVSGQVVSLPFTDQHWNMEGVKITRETFQGKEAISLSSGAIISKNVDLRDGILEFDLSFPQQRGFPGIGFRVQDESNFEHFYVRPHQSGNPDATQYTPVFNNYAGWQLYHGEGYSKATPLKFDQWHHIKIDMHGIGAEIYIDDMQTPFIKVTELKLGWKGGNIALVPGNLQARYANVQYSLKQATAPSAIPVPANGTNGLITRYQLSQQFNREQFDNKLQLSSGIRSSVKWTTQNTESSGTINLAKFANAKDTGESMIVRVVIRSETEQIKALSFGFSEFALIYLNDKPLFFGSDIYLSRDYRFLGTIGFFDMVFLPLKKGDNELWFVITENFGGWGLKARLEDMTGISLR